MVEQETAKRRGFGYTILSCLIVLMTATNSQTENTCSPSKWGENDEIGSANLVTSDQVLMAAKLVKKCKTHPLGIIIEPGVWVSTIPDITKEAAVYLASKEPMAVGADTWGIGAVSPIEGDKIFYDHIALLQENGVFLLKTMNTGRLVREEVKEFMFVLGQARLKGAVSKIINQLALW